MPVKGTHKNIKKLAGKVIEGSVQPSDLQSPYVCKKHQIKTTAAKISRFTLY